MRQPRARSPGRIISSFDLRPVEIHPCSLNEIPQVSSAHSNSSELLVAQETLEMMHLGLRRQGKRAADQLMAILKQGRLSHVWGRTRQSKGCAHHNWRLSLHPGLPLH